MICKECGLSFFSSKDKEERYCDDCIIEAGLDMLDYLASIKAQKIDMVNIFFEDQPLSLTPNINGMKINRYRNEDYINKAWEEAERELCCQISDNQFYDAYQKARKKLDEIIRTEGAGDYNERKKPYYLGKLIAEKVK